MGYRQPTITEIVVKTAVTHTVTYFIMGLVAVAIFDYAHLYAETSLNLLMRPITDPMIMAGPLLQPIRGGLFGLVFYLLKETLFGQRNGWQVLWAMLVVIGIVGTFGPTPGSMEGMIYTVLPLRLHLIGLPEVTLQALLLSVTLCYWVNHREKRWLNWVMGLSFIIVLLLPSLGLMVGQST